jgi:hypothetical protein
MWYNTMTSTHPDMRSVQWGQSAQTTAREVSFALSLIHTKAHFDGIANEQFM